MTTRLKPYPSYKDSGVEWLGEVPEGWEVRRLGSLLRERGEGNDQGEISHVLSLLRGRGVIPYDEKGNIGNKKSDDITRYKIVRPDDIIMNCMNVIIGSVGISRYTGCLSPVYYVLVRRNEADSPHYLNAIFQCSTFHRSLVRIGNGILAHRMRIPMERLKCELLPYPQCAEQTAIVRFLGYMGRRIQRLIRAKQRLIKLLEEQKQAIIHEAVTGRIDVRTGKPYPAYKDSGVVWLGEVPEGWEIKPIMRIGKLFKGNGGSKEDEVPEGIPCVRYGELYTRYEFFIRSTKACVSTSTASAYTRMFPGDVLFAASGETFEDIGRSAVNLLEGIACCGGDVLLLRPSVPMDLQFLGYATDAPPSRHQKATMGRGFTVVHIYASKLKQLMLALPPLPEQTAIVQYLDSHLAGLSSSMESSRRAIDLLNEYRTRLISDVVTGKVDVRKAAALLPDEDEAGGAETLSEEFEEHEPLDVEGFEPEGGDEE